MSVLTRQLHGIALASCITNVASLTLQFQGLCFLALSCCRILHSHRNLHSHLLEYFLLLELGLMTKEELNQKLVELASQYDEPWEPVMILAELAYDQPSERVVLDTTAA